MKILLVAVNAKFIHSNPAVHMLKASCERFSDSIEIAEYAINQNTESILSDIYLKSPDLIAFSCYIWNIGIIRALVNNIPSILPNVPIWLGGPEASYNAEKMLTELPEVTGIMYGEGEAVFNELVSHYILNDIELKNISGLFFKQDSEIIFTGEHALTNIDDLPFVYKDLSTFENKIIYYESSRGCPFRCSYCLSSIDKTVRLRSTDKVLKELQFFLDNNVPQVKFIDRTFNCNKNHALAIWQYLLEHDNGITNFHFEIAADLISEEELSIIEKMRPGLIQLEIGVQTTNPVTIKEIRRSMDLDKLRYVVNKIHSFNNTHQHLDLIAGLPFEDLSSFINSFNDVYSMKPDQLQLGFLKVLQGSYMHEMINEYELKFLSNAPYEVLSTKWLPYSDILLLKGIEEMVELYYNTGQFSNTIAFLEKQFSSPFKLYKTLADDYKENGYDLRKPARSYRYEMLFNFVKKYDPNNLEYYKELLTLDSYLRENCKVRPAFSSDLSEYYEEIRSRTTDKRNHIELFKHINPVTNSRISEPVYIEFDYANRNPLNNNAHIRIV